MTHDPNIQLLIANSRIAQAQAEAAGERLARGAKGSARVPSGSRTSGGARTRRSLAALVLAPVRRVAAVATAVEARRHPAGKAA
jgi:hypothetical protein